MIEIDKGEKKWAETVAGWAEMPKDYDPMLLDIKQFDTDPALRVLTDEEVVEAEAVDDPDNPRMPEPVRPSQERANWLVHGVSSAGRLNIQASQYEELRAEAIGLRQEKRELLKRVEELEASLARSRARSSFYPPKWKHEVRVRNEADNPSRMDIPWVGETKEEARARGCQVADMVKAGSKVVHIDDFYPALYAWSVYWSDGVCDGVRSDKTDEIKAKEAERTLKVVRQ